MILDDAEQAKELSGYLGQEVCFSRSTSVSILN